MMAAVHLLPTLSLFVCSAFLISSVLLSLSSIQHILAWTPAGSNAAMSDGVVMQEQCRSPSLTTEGCLIRNRLMTVFPYNRFDRSRIPAFIWQTWKYSPEDKHFSYSLKTAEESWSRLHSQYLHIVANNEQADDLIKSLYAPVPEVYQAYVSMPLNVHRADFFRFLILFAEGGTYSDIDTDVLKPVWEWVPHNTMQEEEVGIIVGIEADPDTPDWADWYARRLQICQWTIRSKPGHPILADVISKITQETLRMKRLNILVPELMDKSTMEYTGPGTWTDSVFDYFNDPHYFTREDKSNNTAMRLGEKVTSTDFTNQDQRRLVGDVLVLPITSFSPGMGRGAKPIGDPLAFVRHRFQGSWKAEEKVKGAGVGG